MTTIKEEQETSDLQMIRLEINNQEFQQWMESKRLQDTGHALHCLMTECFGKDLVPKPFRLMATKENTSVLYGYETNNSDKLCQAAEMFADPLQLKVMPLSKIDSKPMFSNWQCGQKIGFETQVRPITRKYNKDKNKNQECDVFLKEKEKYPEGDMPYSREQVYSEWLDKEFEKLGGAKLELNQTQLMSHYTTRVYRKRYSTYSGSGGPDATMRGVLTISDPKVFTKLLTRGIGRHRAYGYGMLLLRPTG